MMRQYGHFIDGAFVRQNAGPVFESLNPYTGQAWAELQEGTQADVDDAVRAATRAQSGWWKLNGAARAEVLHRIADVIAEHAAELSVFESTDNGKIVRETRGQMQFAARLFRFFAGYCDKIYGQTIPMDQTSIFDFTVREPFGVVGLITAWNSPITLLCNKLPAALAAGNTVVVKPSEHASVSTLELCKLFKKAGLPEGVVNVVTGGAAVGNAIVTHPQIAKISFTGSPEVGAKIAGAAGALLKPVTLELGGKSANIVFDDADIEAATVGALAGIFAATGQTCVAGSRLLVQRGIKDELISRLVDRAGQIRMGDPLDESSEMGTAANKPQFDRIMDRIAKARDGGAKLVAGGGRGQGVDLHTGLFIQPTIFDDVTNDMEIAQEEVFGPVLSVIAFDTEEEAVQIANDTPYGLATGVWTTDLSRSMRLVPQLKSGVIWVNTYRVVAAQAPFGGVKESGYGRERGEQGLLEYTQTKNVMIDWSGQIKDPFAIKN
ncbi:aldehyde dehydrogenase [Pseudophaeobacter sp.]|jgi:aldehyde dehydrogenase (NAD+)|uniref:aldehyde dehydrogenase n=2 Tax=Pseudophaeobacter sp. TaxID=1971739 RepID=UPI0032D9ABAB